MPSSRAKAPYWRLLVSPGATPKDILLLLGGALAAIAAGAPYPLLGIFFGQLVDSLNSASCNTSSSPGTSGASVSSSVGIEDQVREKVLYVIYVAIANFILIYAHTFFFSLFSERLVRRLRLRYLTALLHAHDVAYFDSLPAGEAACHLDADLQSIQSGTAEKVGLFLSSVSYFVTAYGVAFYLSPRLAGMLVALVPAFGLMAGVGNALSRRYQDRVSAAVNKATSVASAALGNMLVVHAFGAKGRLEGMFASHLRVARSEGLKKSVVSAVQVGLLYFIAYSANALAFWQGSREIARSMEGGDGLSVGAVYTVIFILVDASFIITQVAPFLSLFGNAASAYDKLLPTLELLPDVRSGEEVAGTEMVDIEGEIEFRDVQFSYPSRADVQVLKDFSVKIPAKQYTAIVGPSGSGKSTLVSLMTKVYSPGSGSVLFDGKDTQAFDIRVLRPLFGVVEQNARLFDRSILENIALGLISSPHARHAHLKAALASSALADFAESIQSGTRFELALNNSASEVREIIALVQTAAQRAHASDFIARLPYGLATSVGASGRKLSGGQRQRIALARALVREPSVLILDEATAALDTASERAVLAAVDEIRGSGVTVISIAHRMSSVKGVDRVIVVKEGRVAEEGDYEELVSRGGMFSEMVKMQDGRALGKSKTSQIWQRESIDDIEEDEEEAAHSMAKERQVSKAAVLPAGPVSAVDLEMMDSGTDASADTHMRGILSSMASVLKLARPHLGFIILGATAATAVGASHAGEAVVFGHSLGSLNSCVGTERIISAGNLFGLLFFILAVVELITNFASTASFGRVAEKLLFKVRLLTLRSFLHQDLHWHESQGRTPSSLLTYLSSDTSSLSGLTGVIFGTLLAVVVHMVAGLIVAHIVAWKIAVVLLAAVPILLGSGYFRLRVLNQFQERHQAAFALSVAIALEAIDSIRTIKIFGLEQETIATFQRSLRGPYKSTLKNVAYSNFWMAMAYSVSNVVYALAYWWGAEQIQSGMYTQTQFFIVLPALLFAAQSGGQMFSLAPDISKANIATRRLMSIISQGPTDSSVSDDDAQVSDIEACEEALDLEKAPNTTEGLSVLFDSVRFSYPSRPNNEILHSLTLTVPANSFTALVGPSGSGKSTIFALIERFYTPSSGRILLNGIDYSSRSSVSFRDNIALVPQETILFDGTVRFNISLGARPSDPEPTLSEIEEACRAANIHDMIASLPSGYETMCGSSGRSFSGGELQRLAIARALVRRPKLLLLDEATSALDAASEGLFREALKRISRKVTVVAIAHRLATVRDADVICMIEEGRCVASGRHEELVEGNEAYRSNVLWQMGGC
jgi:ATP-binding cassette subfamily B (MDR/TAP) protein 1